MLRRSHWRDMSCACLAVAAYLLMISFVMMGDWTWGSEPYVHTVAVPSLQAQTENAQLESRLLQVATGD